MGEIKYNFDENLLNNNENETKEKKEELETFEEEKELQEIDVSFHDIWPQIWMGSLANGLSILTGVNTGFSTVFITKLMADPRIIEFSKNEASWIVSLAILSGPIGGIFMGPIMDKLGRKGAIVLGNIFPLLCWSLTYGVTGSIKPLYVARFIGGCGAAMTATVGVYISEISHPRVRGVMMVMVGAFVSLGTLLTMILGSYLEWHTAVLIFALMSGLSLIVALFLPESPIWLVSFKSSPEKLNKALKIAKYFNRSQVLYDYESKKIKDTYAKMKKSGSIQKKKNHFSKWILKNYRLFQEKGVYRPMIILLMVFFFWAFSGVYVILMYSSNIFKAVGSHFGKGFDEYTATIIVGVVKFVMTLISALVSYRVGRRKLIMTSCLGTAVTIFSAAVCQSFSNNKLDFSKTSTNLTDTEIHNNATTLLTVLSLILYILMGSLAITNAPWALISELLPTKARAIGNSIITSYSSIALFIALKYIPLILDFISLSMLFFSFSIVSFIGAAYIYFKLPETLGKNFQEIEEYFT